MFRTPAGRPDREPYRPVVVAVILLTLLALAVVGFFWYVVEFSA